MKNFIVLLALAACLSSHAQVVAYRHSLSGDLGPLGDIKFTGLFLQYGYQFKHSARGFYDARLGFGGYSAGTPYYGVGLPHSVTYNFGKARHFFEVGIAGTLSHEFYQEVSSSKYFVGPLLGYRSISRSGFQFRIYANPSFDDRGFRSPFGIGFGKAFGKR